MFSFIITNTLDLGLWTMTRLFNGGYYIIFGDTEKEMLKKELSEIKDTLRNIEKKISKNYVLV